MHNIKITSETSIVIWTKSDFWKLSKELLLKFWLIRSKIFAYDFVLHLEC